MKNNRISSHKRVSLHKNADGHIINFLFRTLYAGLLVKSKYLGGS